MRLRRQLTLSHLAAVAVTLVSMIAAIVLLVTLVIFPHVSPGDQAVAYARTVAASVGSMLGDGSQQLDGALRVLADQTPRSGPPFGPPARFSGGGPSLNVAYIAVVGPGGEELASSDPSGAAFAPPERAEWAPLASRALAGETRPSELLALRGSSASPAQAAASGNSGSPTGPVSGAQGPAALAAYPVLDSSGQAEAAVIVGLTSLPGGGFGFSQALAFFGAASVVVLLAASLFALGSSSLVAYLLSRRVVRRLERLGETAEALAGGNLEARVQDGGEDEVGQLARRFNQMSADLQRLLTQLREERDRVTGLLKARRELVASVSHELRTPVATVRGYVESALRGQAELPNELRADLETVEAEVGRLQRLIDDLFTLSRAEVGRLELRLEPTDVGEVVRSTVDTMAPLAWEQWRVQVVAEAADGLRPAQADSERLRQVLSNLLSNAIRHTPPGGLVAATAGSENGHLRLDVRDTGAGIAAEDMPHIFERFYRGRGEAGAEGAGLGLAVAKELVEAMGGSIEAASADGEGSCFTVRLGSV